MHRLKDGACASVGAGTLHQGKQLHAQTREQELEEDVLVGNGLVNMYAKCGSLEDARKLFDRLPERNVVTWTAMIAGYVQQGIDLEALTLYSRMQQESSTCPNTVTFVCLLQVCASIGVRGLHPGKQLHAHIEERGLQGDGVVGATLVSMYAKCGSTEDARSMFDSLPEKDIVTWYAVLASYAQQGLGEEPLASTRSCNRRACLLQMQLQLLVSCRPVGVGIRALHHGEQLHAQIEEQGLQADAVVGGSLVNMYAKCGSLEDARKVFDKLSAKNVVAWNAMLGGYTRLGMGEEALYLSKTMQQEGVTPDSLTFSVGVGAVNEGKRLHAQMLNEQGWQDDVVLGGSLVNMYVRCASLEDARSLFDRLSVKNVVAWTIMIADFAQREMGEEAPGLYRSMQQEGLIVANPATFVCLLQACANVGVGPQRQGKQLHAEIEAVGLQGDVVVGGSLLNMYAKCGRLEDASGEQNVSETQRYWTYGRFASPLRENGRARSFLRGSG